MTKEQVQELARQEAQAVYNSNEARYKTFKEVPSWARESAEDVYERLGLTGTGTEGEVKLNASATYVRVLYVLDKLLELIDKELGED